MLLAYELRAHLIVAVGTHATMVEFLDKGRGGMSSTFLTRLRLGPMLVDAKGVSQLYKGRCAEATSCSWSAARSWRSSRWSSVSHSLHALLDGFRVTFDGIWS